MTLKLLGMLKVDTSSLLIIDDQTAV